MRGIISVIFIAIVLFQFFYYNDNSGKTLKYWIQPDSVKYEKFRYRLSVLETTRAIGLFTETTRHHEIIISKQSVKPELDTMYGHYKEYGFEGEEDEIKVLLDQCQVRWKKEGVWFMEPDGHKLFFPKNTFMGGR